MRVPRLRVDKKLPSYLTKEEVKILLDNTIYLKHKAILSTIYSSGLRVSEAINLRISDIISKEMKIRVRKVYFIIRKKSNTPKRILEKIWI